MLIRNWVSLVCAVGVQYPIPFQYYLCVLPFKVHQQTLLSQNRVWAGTWHGKEQGKLETATPSFANPTNQRKLPMLTRKSFFCKCRWWLSFEKSGRQWAILIATTNDLSVSYSILRNWVQFCAHLHSISPSELPFWGDHRVHHSTSNSQCLAVAAHQSWEILG